MGGARYDPSNVPDFLHCPNGMILGKRFHDEAVKMDPYMILPQYQGPVLLYFTGYCDCQLFHGAIQPGAVDLQTHANGHQAVLHAEYTLSGVDAKGKACTLSVVNEKKGEDYAPVVTTDSAELQWLHNQPLTAALEGFDGGLTVRIFGQLPRHGEKKRPSMLPKSIDKNKHRRCR